jgi:hypothetical protein
MSIFCLFPIISDFFYQALATYLHRSVVLQHQPIFVPLVGLVFPAITMANHNSDFTLIGNVLWI